MDAKTKRAKSIFMALVGKVQPEYWNSHLDVACGEDGALRQELESLLAAHVPADSFLAQPAAAVVASASPSAVVEAIDDAIGPYKLLEQIGEGGFGVVFMAEQERPVKRRVALKVIKPGMDTRQVIARFEAERQALAMMDHPNIAKVHDAGATENGRPYFVMELVQGVPITEYCDKCNLGTRERLELFITVCQAVQHAHQKGVIHRDIKPTNILVTMQDGRAAPKVIDFGVAKAIEQRLTEHTLTTAFAQMVGTPLYMSPEQAELSPLGVDTRSDIYSLGVLLYELLTGATPFDKDRLHSASYDELRRIIREEEPPRPSARFSTLAQKDSSTISERHHIDPRQLSKLFQGELDWIVMKCLEKDRNRRYESAAALAADVRHYLSSEPVSAVAPSRLYRARKFICRNKWPVIATAAVFAGLIAGIISTTVALVSQSRQRTIAERERAEAQLNFAVALQAQRDYVKAENLYRQQLENSRAETPADRQRVALTRLRLAEIVSDTRGAAESEPLYRDALAAYRDAFPPGDANIAHAVNSLALVLRLQQRFAEAEPLFREAFEIHRQALPADHRAIGESATNLANVLISLGRFADAEPLAREAVAQHQLAVPQDVWALVFARVELGRDLISLGKFSDAERELLDAQRILQTTDRFQLGPLSLAALYTRWNQVDPGKGYDTKAQQYFRELIRTYVPLETAENETSKK